MATSNRNLVFVRFVLWLRAFGRLEQRTLPQLVWWFSTGPQVEYGLAHMSAISASPQSSGFVSRIRLARLKMRLWARL